MQLLPADYAICAVAVVMAVLGLFRGLSGTLAFAAASAAALFVVSFGWAYSAGVTSVVWQRAGVVLLAVLVAFAFVRIIVKKFVNGMLAQPSDAIFGMLAGLAMSALLVLAWAWSGVHAEYSRLVQEVAVHVR